MESTAQRTTPQGQTLKTLCIHNLENNARPHVSIQVFTTVNGSPELSVQLLLSNNSVSKRNRDWKPLGQGLSGRDRETQGWHAAVPVPGLGLGPRGRRGSTGRAAAEAPHWRDCQSENMSQPVDPEPRNQRAITEAGEGNATRTKHAAP